MILYFGCVHFLSVKLCKLFLLRTTQKDSELQIYFKAWVYFHNIVVWIFTEFYEKLVSENIMYMVSLCTTYLIIYFTLSPLGPTFETCIISFGILNPSWIRPFYHYYKNVYMYTYNISLKYNVVFEYIVHFWLFFHI